MVKLVEALVILSLIIFAFFMGVKYSNQVKSRASWIFDSKIEEEIEMPNLSDQNEVNIDQNVDENGNNIDNKPRIDDAQIIEQSQDNGQEINSNSPDKK